MSNEYSENYLEHRLSEMGKELENLSRMAKPESAEYMNFPDLFERVNAMYKDIDVELISMQSGLHENTIRRLFTKRDAFFNAKLCNLEKFLDVLGISLWAR